VIDIQHRPLPAPVGSTAVGDQLVAVHPDVPAAVEVGSLWRRLGMGRRNVDSAGEQQRGKRTECFSHEPLLLMFITCNSGSLGLVPLDMSRPLASALDAS
jgi:hypothetical protein